MDHIKDVNHSVLYRIATETNIPSFALETDLDEKTASELPSSCFADSFLREYPIDSKGAAWLSLAYFKRTGDNNMLTKEALDNACKIWQLTEDEIKLAITPPIEKAASFGTPLRVLDHSGAIIWQTSISGQQDFEKIASDIIDHAADYSYPARHQIAGQLLKLAAEGHYEIPFKHTLTLQKYAALAAVHKDDLLDELENRRLGLQLNQEDFRNKLFKLASEVKASCPELVDSATMQKCASITDIIDSFVDRHRFNQPLELTVKSVPTNLFKHFQKQAVAIGSHFAPLSKVAAQLSTIKEYLVATGTLKEACQDTEVLSTLGELPAGRAAYVLSLVEG